MMSNWGMENGKNILSSNQGKKGGFVQIEGIFWCFSEILFFQFFEILEDKKVSKKKKKKVLV